MLLSGVCWQQIPRASSPTAVWCALKRWKSCLYVRPKACFALKVQDARLVGVHSSEAASTWLHLFIWTWRPATPESPYALHQATGVSPTLLFYKSSSVWTYLDCPFFVNKLEEKQPQPQQTHTRARAQPTKPTKNGNANTDLAASADSWTILFYM